MTHRERNRRWSTSHGRRLARRREYGARVDAGLCVACGQPSAPDAVKCAACLAEVRTARADRAARGLCRDCPAASAPGRARCEACHARNNAATRDALRRERAMARDAASRAPTRTIGTAPGPSGGSGRNALCEHARAVSGDGAETAAGCEAVS